jgi:hypothetical protein
MTSYSGSIDLTESLTGVKFSAIAGSGGVTVGTPVKWDGSNANTVVASGATSDVIVGIARDTAALNGAVTVLSDGCLVLVPYTLTVGGKVGLDGSGGLTNWTTGTLVGTVVKSATLASWVRVQIQY